MDVTPAMDTYREETPGSIAAVLPFDDAQEGIGLADDTMYDLASYVYTRDIGRAVRVSEALRFGSVGIDDIDPTVAGAPFGDTLDSGLGREGGSRGMDEYLDDKLVGLTL